jgi:hypothetical protein
VVIHLTRRLVLVVLWLVLFGAAVPYVSDQVAESAVPAPAVGVPCTQIGQNGGYYVRQPDGTVVQMCWVDPNLNPGRPIRFQSSSVIVYGYSPLEVAGISALGATLILIVGLGLWLGALWVRRNVRVVRG